MKKKKEKKKCPPSSVAHYTSLGVVQLILEKALDSKDGFITLHLSALTMMNDSGEGKYVLDRYFRDSIIKQDKKTTWDNEFYPKHMPFVLSTIRTTISSKDKGALPMWKMYGDDCKGTFIRFNVEKLKEYCESKGLLFEEVKYLTTNEVSKQISDFNQDGAAFEDILKAACLTKAKCWEYEHEWRAVLFADKDKVKTKCTPRGVVNFIELEPPLDIIEEICLGPQVDWSVSGGSINLLKDQLDAKYPDKVHFKVTKSKIGIR